MKKNIIIISNHLHYFNMGGVEEYTRNLILALRQKYNVYEFGISIFFNNEVDKCIPITHIGTIDEKLRSLMNKTFSETPSSVLGKIIRLLRHKKINQSIQKQFNNYVKIKKQQGIKFDLIILNTKELLLKKIDYNKTIFCQHNDNIYFKNKINLKEKMISFFLNGTTKNVWDLSKYVSTMNLDGKFGKKNENNILMTFPIDKIKIQHMPFDLSKDICFVGRPVKGKGIFKINEFAEKYKLTIDIFGPRTKEISICNFLNYKKQLDPKSAETIFCNYKLCILFSDEEGLGLVLANSLRNGTPIITRKNGWYNEHLLNMNDNLRFDILDENAYKEIKQITENSNTWGAYSQKAYKTFDNFFSKSNFANDWNNFINHIISGDLNEK